MRALGSRAEDHARRAVSDAMADLGAGLAVRSRLGTVLDLAVFLVKSYNSRVPVLVLPAAHLELARQPKHGLLATAFLLALPVAQVVHVGRAVLSAEPF